MATSNNTESLADRKKRLDKFGSQLEKKYGKPVIFTGKEAIDSGKFDYRILETPSMELNKALYCGGLGRIVELFGAPASGKTSLAIETLALAQKNDPSLIGLWVETEDSIFPEILEQHGVDMERTQFISQADIGEAEGLLDIVVGAATQGIVDVIIVNSIAGLVPKPEVESDLEKQNIALTARTMSKFFRKITSVLGKNNITSIFINQIRDNVGVSYGDPTTTTGGRALAFYASQRIRMNANKIKAEDPLNPEEGVKISCIVNKNRFAGQNNPYTKCVYYARYSSGIDSIISIPQMLLDNNTFTKGGSWWYYKDANGNPIVIEGIECKFRSTNEFIETMRNNEKFLNAMRNLLQVDSASLDEVAKIQAEQLENAQAFDEYAETLKEMVKEKQEEGLGENN